MLSLFVVIASACSSDIIVRTDFDKSVSVQRLTEYGWLGQHDIESRNNPLLYNELNDKRIRDEVNKQLKAKGYVFSETAPKMLVHYHVTVEERSVIRPEQFGYSYGRYWQDQRADLIRYAEGTLIIDLMDATNCNLLWRGWATAVVDDSRVMKEELLRRAVTDIFKRFPESAVMEMTTR